jgi:hypothetical protein
MGKAAALDARSKGFADVELAATEGRIELLLLPRDCYRWAPERCSESWSAPPVLKDEGPCSGVRKERTLRSWTLCRPPHRRRQ